MNQQQDRIAELLAASAQRALHEAGCQNVVSAIMKVNDTATVALMNKCYYELFVHNKPPITAFREVQLAVRRHPELIEAMAGERGKPDSTTVVKPNPLPDGAVP